MKYLDKKFSVGYGDSKKLRENWPFKEKSPIRRPGEQRSPCPERGMGENEVKIKKWQCFHNDCSNKTIHSFSVDVWSPVCPDCKRWLAFIGY